ncbi:MAG: hypothetical protein IKJ19_03645 [Clostridia bacterium]|nr:hypothetical protein [Clostridia bacterium]
MNAKYHFPPITLLSDIPQDELNIGLNYEFLDEVCSFIESKIVEKDLGYQLVGVEYGFNFTELKFLDKTTFDARSNIMMELGYDRVTEFYADLEHEIINHFNFDGVSVCSANTYASEQNAFSVSILHKYCKQLSLKSILEQCKIGEPKYYFCVQEDLKPYLLLGKQMQFVSLAVQNNVCIKQTINCMLTGLITLCSPNDASLIVVANDNSYDVYNKIPHLVFGEVIKDFKIFPAVYEYIARQIELRKRLFEEEQVEDIYGYNEKAIDKISKLFVVIDDFGGVYNAFNDKWKDIIHDISKAAKLGDKYGVYFLVVAPLDKSPVLIPLKYGSNTKIAFKVNNPMTSLSVLDNAGAYNLLFDNDAYINAKFFVRTLRRVVTATISNNEVERVCNFIRANNSSEDKKHLIKGLYAKCEELNKKQELTEEELFLQKVKELVKSTLGLTYFSLMGASGTLKTDAKQTKKIVDYCLEKNYIAWYNKFNYKPNLTKEEYKKIFND